MRQTSPPIADYASTDSTIAVPVVAPFLFGWFASFAVCGILIATLIGGYALLGIIVCPVAFLLELPLFILLRSLIRPHQMSARLAFGLGAGCSFVSSLILLLVTFIVFQNFC